jgi:hypothetical protein
MSKVSDFSDVILSLPIAIAIFKLKEGKVDLLNLTELYILTRIFKEFIH